MSEARLKISQLETEITKLGEILTKADVARKMSKRENYKLISEKLLREHYIEDINKSVIRKELQNVQYSSHPLGKNTNTGFSRLTIQTQTMQRKQMGLLDQFSTNIRQNKIDDKYRDTIKKLVAEHVRNQRYITHIPCERDQV